ncbi:MAG: glycoside hydrolase family 2 protein, partial [Alicyclobacillus macrosporangiidus]|uniref:glycoside hydrolase family 2 protein n=1 Tax=Alicyclobacillus macrosporangiidus TaxID=392015 RepID=UPI0026EEE047
MQLHDNWKIKGFQPGTAHPSDVAIPNYDDQGWLPAEVPGDVHTTLIRHRVIEHPFFHDNDQRCRWVEEQVWWYRTWFSFEEELQPDEQVVLVFEGLDTFATVYLNGLEVAESANMFVPLTVDVTRELVRGRNTLAIRFDPVAQRLHDKDVRFWSGFSGERIWVRKAQMHFGWDWAPRLVTAGIWKPVRLERRRIARVASVAVRTLDASEAEATLQVAVDVAPVASGSSSGASSGPSSVPSSGLEVAVRLEDGGVLVASHRRPAGFGRFETTLRVRSPKLWWTHDLGEPHLYRLVVEVSAGGVPVDRAELEVGIRTLEVRTRDAEGRPAFTFVLNGVPVFAKGANWIPVDSFVAAAPDSRYLALLELVREAHMNMLRVWGGGVYEKDVFYETCDRLGILVWQDFMFACALYPDFNQPFLREVEREVRHVVTHLRNHPCIALWCGNNENDWIWERGRVTGEIDTPFYGERIYHELIPALLAELDPGRFYWPSSPYGGSDHNAAEEGDRHNWQVWHGHVYPRRFGEPEWTNFTPGGISFRHYAEDEARFVSEFGIHAAANRQTLARWIPPEEL